MNHQRKGEKNKYYCFNPAPSLLPRKSKKLSVQLSLQLLSLYALRLTSFYHNYHRNFDFIKILIQSLIFPFAPSSCLIYISIPAKAKGTRDCKICRAESRLVVVASCLCHENLLLYQIFVSLDPRSFLYATIRNIPQFNLHVAARYMWPGS